METKRSNSRKKSHSPKAQQVTSTWLCLNPHCPCSQRQYCLTLKNKQPEGNSMHKTCEGWGLNINELFSGVQQYQTISQQSFDFLLNPVHSILSLTYLAKNQWLEQIKNIFSIMQKQLNDYISTLLQSKYKEIYNSIAEVTKTAQNIHYLASSVQKQHWSHKEQKFYHDILQKDLEKIHNFGRLNVFNYEVVSGQIDVVKQHFERLLWGVWDFEADYIRDERLKDLQEKKVVSNCKRDMNKVEAHLKLQQICKKLKIQLTSVQEKNNQLYIRCPKCHIIITSNKQFKQQKKTDCIFLLLEHFYDVHQEHVAQNNIKNNVVRHRLKYNEFIRQIMSCKYKQYVIVDRENINTEKAVQSPDNEIYTLEVIAKTRQNLARGRYLVAESTGKDAADILSIIVVYDLCKLVGRSKVTLITNDHFGRTLQPILESIGVKIQLSNSLKIEMKAHVENEQMMIQQF